MIRLGGVRLFGLAVVVVGLIGATATGSSAREADGLRVSADGVAFDRWQVPRGAALEYTVRPLDGEESRYSRHFLTRSEWNAEWVALHEAPQRFPDGYCVSWLRLGHQDWGEWMNGPVCWEPESAPMQSAAADDEPSGGPVEQPAVEASSDPVPDPAPTPASEPPASPEPSDRPEAEPEPSPATPEPTPEPAASEPQPDPSPGSSLSTEPRPLRSTPGLTGLALAKSFGLASPDDAPVLQRSSGLPWMWVALGGIGAAAGGALLMMFRRPF